MQDPSASQGNPKRPPLRFPRHRRRAYGAGTGGGLDLRVGIHLAAHFSGQMGDRVAAMPNLSARRRGRGLSRRKGPPLQAAPVHFHPAAAHAGLTSPLASPRRR
jgi:hypothetical protein